MSATRFPGRDFLTTLDYTPGELAELVAYARALKAGRADAPLERRVASLLFFNPSVRTRVSCESALARYGGTGITIQPGSDSWNFEWGEGAVMDGSTQEHVRELAPVLSRMSHWLGVRKSDLITTAAGTAAGIGAYEELARDPFLHALREHAEVPVLNLESNRFHPLQGLADATTIQERMEDPRGVKFVLTWAWHPKALPVATPHSQLLAAANLGMDVTLLRPEGYGLEPAVVEAARQRAESQGGALRETDDVEGAYRGARVVCAKSWGSLARYGLPEQEAAEKESLRGRWIVDEEKLALTEEAFFLHCLPLRRNVIATDAVMNSAPRCAVIDEAENRLWTAAAVLGALAPER